MFVKLKDEKSNFIFFKVSEIKVVKIVAKEESDLSSVEIFYEYKANDDKTRFSVPYNDYNIMVLDSLFKNSEDFVELYGNNSISRYIQRVEDIVFFKDKLVMIGGLELIVNHPLLELEDIIVKKKQFKNTEIPNIFIKPSVATKKVKA